MTSLWFPLLKDSSLNMKKNGKGGIVSARDGSNSALKRLQSFFGGGLQYAGSTSGNFKSYFRYFQFKKKDRKSVV